MPAGGNEADYLVTARDIRTVVAELWLAGAEAISINGERVTISTAIIDIGGIGPRQRGLLSPAVPDPGDRPDGPVRPAVGLSQGWRDFVQTRRGSFGIGISFAEPAEVDIPAFAGSLTLRESRIVAARRRPSSAPSGAAP